MKRRVITENESRTLSQFLDMSYIVENFKIISNSDLKKMIDLYTSQNLSIKDMADRLDLPYHVVRFQVNRLNKGVKESRYTLSKEGFLQVWSSLRRKNSYQLMRQLKISHSVACRLIKENKEWI